MKTVSLEIAKKLKEKGLSLKDQGLRVSNFLWIENKGLLEGFVLQQSFEDDYSLVYYSDELKIEQGTKIFYAPTAEEMLERLPYVITIHEKLKPLQINKFIDGYGASYSIHDNCYAETLSDALAHMWLYLKENNLL